VRPGAAVAVPAEDVLAHSWSAVTTARLSAALAEGPSHRAYGACAVLGGFAEPLRRDGQVLVSAVPHTLGRSPHGSAARPSGPTLLPPLRGTVVLYDPLDLAVVVRLTDSSKLVRAYYMDVVPLPGVPAAADAVTLSSTSAGHLVRLIDGTCERVYPMPPTHAMLRGGRTRA
jgi:hypothetical protein